MPRSSRSASSSASPARELAAYVVGVETECACRARSTSTTTTRAGIRQRRSAPSARRPRPPTCSGSTLDRTARRWPWPPRSRAGIKANFGTMTKPLHVGHVGRNGLFAALIAQRGFNLNPGALRAQAGLARGLQRQGHLRHRAHVRGLGFALEIATPDGLKQFPCCGSTIPPSMILWRW